MRKVLLGAVALLLAASCQFSTSGLKTSTSVGGPSSGGQSSSSSTPVTVPNVFRMPRAAAEAALRKAGITGTISTDSSLCGSVVDGVIIELGEVCYQHPAAGQTTGSRLPMTLRIQTEDPRHGRIGEHMEWHLMPDVVGMKLADARKAMRAAGFTEARTRIDTRVEDGCKPFIVCRQYPTALERAGQNSDRVLIVGADPSAAVKPDSKPTTDEKPATDKKPGDGKPPATTESAPFF